MKKLLLFAGIVLSIGSFRSLGQSVVYHPGIYSLGTTDQAITFHHYDSAYVAGGAVRVSWANLEPTEGSYNWSFLNTEIATARNKGKKISIFFGGGVKSPEWLLQDPSVHFFYLADGANIDTLPVPYDSIYISKLCRFISAFGKHYKDSTTIAYIRGATEDVTNGWALPNTDNMGRTWVGHYHFTTDTLLYAMKKVLDTFMAAFPNTPEWAEVGKSEFDTGGHGTPKHDNIYTGEQIAAYGFSTYPDRFNVWREDFNACFPVPPDTASLPHLFYTLYWHILWDHPCHNGAQAVWNVQDVACDSVPRMDQCDGASPCPIHHYKDSVLWWAVTRAFKYKMTYLEIYGTDIVDLTLHGTLKRTADSLSVLGSYCFSGIGHREAGSAIITGAGDNFEWSLYPNPTKDEIHITASSSASEQVRYELHDMTGRLIRTVSLMLNGTQTITMNVSDCPAGSYLITLSRNGKVYETKKVTLMK